MSTSPSSSPLEPAWSVGESLDRVIDAVRGKVNSVRRLSDGSYLVNCLNPAHPDEKPSLHISHLDDADGGHTAFFCQSRCGRGVYRDWAHWAGVEFDDLWDDRRWSRRRHSFGSAPAPRPRPAGVKSPWGKLGRKPELIRPELHALLGQPKPVDEGSPDHQCDWVDVETYSYPDGIAPNRRVTRQRCRHEGCKAKNFPQTFLKRGADPAKSSSWVIKSKAGWGSDWSDQLYRHHQVVDAVADKVPVWTLEGEKDVHEAEGRGLVATTNPGGARNFASHLAEVFRGADEVNIPIDRDAAGVARTVRLHQLFTAQRVHRIRLWLPATTAAKSDFSDHFAAGYEIDDLIPVPLPAVTAWHLLDDPQRVGTVANLAEQLQTAAAEQEAQLQVAELDRQEGRRAVAQDRVRFAIRWAKESVLVYQQLVEAAHAVAAQVQQVPPGDPGRPWAEQAVEIAQSQLRAGRSLILAATERSGLIIPTSVDVDDVVLSTAPLERGLPADGSGPDGGAAGRHLHAVPGGGNGGGDGGPGGPGGPGGTDGGGGAGGGRFDPDTHIERERYEVLGGELVQVFWAARRDGSSVRRNRAVINTPVRLVSKEIAEDDEALEDERYSLSEIPGREGRDGVARIRNLTKMTHVVLEVPDLDGVPARLRVPFDDYDSGAFLSHLPVANLQFPRGRSGRDKVITAVNAVSDAEIATSYRATGWRRRKDDSYMYVTADGAIDAKGWQPLATNLTGPMARFNLPNPSTDPARLREVFVDGTTEMMHRFPDRVAAVLIGQAFRAAICPSEWTTVLSGSPGSKKTGMAALAMHYFGETWDRNRPASSMSGNGATDNAIRLMANQAKDAVLFLDDNAPTSGLEAAYKRLESTNRLLSNQEGRPRATRDGQGSLPETKPRTSGLITSEMPARAGTSGDRRELLVPLAKNDISLDAVKDLDAMPARHARALLMASYLQWVAGDFRGSMLRCRQLRDDFEHAIHRDTSVRPVVAKEHGTKVAELWAGWALLLEFLADRGAITGREQDSWKERVTQALLEAAESAEDPDAVESTGQRICDLLQHALGSGLAYVADAATGGPPRGLERRLGWHTSTGTTAYPDGSPADWRVETRAICLGYLAESPDLDDDDLELIVQRFALDAVLKATAAGMTDSSGTDPGTVIRALEEEGILKIEQTVGPTGRPVIRKTLRRTIPCLPSTRESGQPVRERRHVLRLAALFGERPGPDLHGPNPAGPDPTGPHPVGPDMVGPAGPVEQNLRTTSEHLHDDPDQTGSDSHLEPTPTNATALSDPLAPLPTPPMETAMDHTNTAGLTLPRIGHEQTRPCVVCGLSCGVELGGLPLHPPCFWPSTSDTVDQLHEEVVELAKRRRAQTHPDVTTGLVTGTPATLPAAAPKSDAETPTRPAQPAVPVLEQGRRRKPPAQPARFRAAVCVVDVDLVWLPDGSSRPLPRPITHLGDLEQLGRDLNLGSAPVGWHSWTEPGTVVPTTALWEQLGVPITEIPRVRTDRDQWLADLSAQLPALTDAAAMGWVFGRGDGAPLLRGVTKLRRREDEHGAVRILLTAVIDPDWGLGDDVAPATLARRLQLHADTLGIGFNPSPANTAIDLFNATATKAVRDALTPVDWSTIPPALNRSLSKQFNWTRVPQQEDRAHPLLVLWDRGQSYAGTWAGLKVGMGAPVHHDGPVKFTGQVGWWRITVPNNTVGGKLQHPPYPDILDPTGTASGTVRWVTTPALEAALEFFEIHPQIHEAYLWPAERTRQCLRPVYERIRAALAALQAIDDDDARAVEWLVKRVYKELSGYVISDRAMAAGSGLSQPYWQHAMIAKAQSAMLRQILTVGEKNAAAGRPNVWPLVVSQTDLIGYAADSIDPPETAWPGDPTKLGRGPGRYKPGRYADLESHLKYLTGKAWTGERDTTAFTAPAAKDLSDQSSSTRSPISRGRGTRSNR